MKYKLPFCLPIVAGVIGSWALGAYAESKPVRPNPAIKHVFVITLENKDFSTTFGVNSAAPYLSQTLVAKGALLKQYFATGHVSADNYISMLSGQAETPQTQSDCQTYADFKQAGTTSDGQAIGTGCVYPPSVQTLPDQLTAVGLSWKAYMEDMGNDPARESATCGHPVLDAKDLTQMAEAPSASVPAGDQYVTRHNPFVYFHSIIDSKACAKNVVSLKTLKADLQSIATTANFIFITPNVCSDGHDAPCVTGKPGGLISIDAFLHEWVPVILASPAYRKDGLLIINFDESAPTEASVDAQNGYRQVVFPGAACCNEQPGPNVTFPSTTKFSTFKYEISYLGVGGGQTGAVLLSPLIKPGTISSVPYNHYSMLRSIEDIFGLEYLGYAGQPGLVSFGNDVYTVR